MCQIKQLRMQIFSIHRKYNDFTTQQDDFGLLYLWQVHFVIAFGLRWVNLSYFASASWITVDEGISEPLGFVQWENPGNICQEVWHYKQIYYNFEDFSHVFHEQYGPMHTKFYLVILSNKSYWDMNCSTKQTLTRDSQKLH